MTGLLLRLDNLVEGYVEVVDAVLAEGAPAAPNGKPTTEVLAATILVPGDAPMLPVGTGRKVSTDLAAVEAVQVVGGYSDAAAFARWPHMAEFMDGGSFHGAYGPHIRPQLDLVVRRLTADPQSRRAVVTVWDPLRDRVEGVRNYPCTTELQFMARLLDEPRAVVGYTRGISSHAASSWWGLDLHVTMRANDAWHGLAYDAFVFNQLQHTIARALGFAVGTYYHHAASLHVYEEHVPLAEQLTLPVDAPALQPSGFSTTARARYVGLNPGVAARDHSEEWYLSRLAKVAA